MQTPAIPPNESQRLQSLHALALLGTEAEERFDRFTRLAKRLFDVPISLVSLVDEHRQWFKSCDGLTVRETPRDISFCGHAILGDGVFVIQDAQQDARFADNPLVLNAPNIRFYAGCPLRVAGSAKVGTLCLLDSYPRGFNTEEMHLLRDLTGMLESELLAYHTTTVDGLTQITNRRGFMMLAPYVLQICQRQSLPASLAFIDLDQFKPINDRFGHAEGDLALIAFTDIMKSSFRRADVFARLGGDEFVVLMSDTNKTQAEAVMAKFASRIQTHNRTAGKHYDLTYSCGIVEFQPAKHATIEALLAETDACMYAIKRARQSQTSRA